MTGARKRLAPVEPARGVVNRDKYAPSPRHKNGHNTPIAHPVHAFNKGDNITSDQKPGSRDPADNRRALTDGTHPKDATVLYPDTHTGRER